MELLRQMILCHRTWNRSFGQKWPGGWQICSVLSPDCFPSLCFSSMCPWCHRFNCLFSAYIVYNRTVNPRPYRVKADPWNLMFGISQSVFSSLTYPKIHNACLFSWASHSWAQEPKLGRPAGNTKGGFRVLGKMQNPFMVHTGRRGNLHLWNTYKIPGTVLTIWKCSLIHSSQ